MTSGIVTLGTGLHYREGMKQEGSGTMKRTKLDAGSALYRAFLKLLKGWVGDPMAPHRPEVGRNVYPLGHARAGHQREIAA